MKLIFLNPRNKNEIRSTIIIKDGEIEFDGDDFYYFAYIYPEILEGKHNSFDELLRDAAKTLENTVLVE